MAEPKKTELEQENGDSFNADHNMSATGSGSRRSLSFGARNLARSGRKSANWATAPETVFTGSRSRSEAEYGDEEALKWAALERLPTYDRLRTTVLERVEGGKDPVDLRSLDQATLRNELLGKLFQDSAATDSNIKFLLKLRERIDRVGVTLPTVEVRYKDLNIEATTHLGGRSLPTLYNSAANAIEGFFGAFGLNLSKKTDITILHEVSGVIKPGRMTLLLGPPSSGKTTLLLALAGKLDRNLKVKGEITFNGYKMNEFVPQKTAAYVDQQDLHVPQMTVRETLEYSAKSQDVGENRYDLLSELHKREKELGVHPEAVVDYYMKASALKQTSSSVVSDYVMKILGLDICADTLVGDDMVRGISGGQRKRVTTGEMIVGPMKTLFMDEISTGLDSSTTFQIVQYLKDITHVLESTVLISLLQPAPETFELFDDIILLSEGQIVYHGPREHVLDFFASCGFKSPERKGIADFLQEVTSRKDQEQYWVDKSKPYEFVPVKEFAAAFSKFQDGVATTKELETPFDKAKSHDGALQFKPYTLSNFEMLKVNFGKEVLLLKRNAFIYVFKTTQIGLMALLAMATFFRTTMPRKTTDDAQVYAGALFFGVSNFLFNGYAELALMIARLPLFYKQRDMLFYPAWVFCLSTWILSIPISIVEVFIWTSITYYTIGFAPGAQRFFRQLFIYFWMHQMSSGQFRIIAGLCRSMVLANTGGTFLLLCVFTLGGFLIQRPNIKPWWIWGYYVSPLTYAQNGAEVNEFLAERWNRLTDGHTEGLGIRYLKMSGVFPHSYWYWISVGALMGFTFLFNIIFTWTLYYFNPLKSAQAVMSEEQRAEAHANLTGEILEPRSMSKKSMARSLSRGGGGASVKRKSGLANVEEDGTNGDVQMSGRPRASGLSADERRSEILDSKMRGSRKLSTSRSRTSMELDDADGVAPKRGMTLPFKPLAMSFDEVKYFVPMPAQMKTQGVTEDKLQLLRGITGAFRPGVLTALVGVSGAGKTTLMDVLAGRKTGGTIEGDIRIAGFPKVQETFARISGYCEQFDIHSPQVTIHESLLYSAWLRLSEDVDDNEKKIFVNEVMDLVELTSLKDALVGLPGITGLSTEQRKRLTIAVELVANPSIIFMDEPTSGLDARAAAIVMRTVRNTVDTGRTVVCTIHQPSIDIFEAFDDLLLMKRGGQVIYAGPLGRHSHKLVEFFQAVPGVPKIREGYNPATWMLEISTAAQEQRLGVDFADVYANSSLHKRNKALVQGLSKPAEGAEDLSFPTQYSQPFFSQLTSCLWKQHLTYWRSPYYNNVRLIFGILAALLFGTLFWRVGKKRDSQPGIAAAAGSLVAAVLFVGINNSSTVQPVVATERTVFYRERAAGMYSAGPYAIAQVLIEIPYLLVLTTVYGTITYALLGMEWTPAKFFWYFYFMFFSFAYFTYYGMMAVGITPNHQVAAVVASAFYQIWNLFSGYLITRRRAPKWVSWYFWASPTAWTLYGLAVSQFQDVGSKFTIRSTGEETTVSRYVDEYFGFKGSYMGFAAAMMLVYTFLFAFIFMLAIKYLNFQNR